MSLWTAALKSSGMCVYVCVSVLLQPDDTSSSICVLKAPHKDLHVYESVYMDVCFHVWVCDVLCVMLLH